MQTPAGPVSRGNWEPFGPLGSLGVLVAFQPLSHLLMLGRWRNCGNPSPELGLESGRSSPGLQASPPGEIKSNNRELEHTGERSRITKPAADETPGPRRKCWSPASPQTSTLRPQADPGAVTPGLTQEEAILGLRPSPVSPSLPPLPAPQPSSSTPSPGSHPSPLSSLFAPQPLLHLQSPHLRPVVDLDKHRPRVCVIGAPLADVAPTWAREGTQGRGAQLGAQQLLHGGRGRTELRDGTGETGEREEGPRDGADCPAWDESSGLPRPLLSAGEATVSRPADGCPPSRPRLPAPPLRGKEGEGGAGGGGKRGEGSDRGTKAGHSPCVCVVSVPG